MTRLDRYIQTTVLQATALVLLVLGGLDLIFTLVDEIGETDAVYGIADAARYVLLTFPRHIYELLPMTVLIGSLVGLGFLASSNELVVVQSAGISAMRIVWAVMKPALVIMLAGFILGEYVAPRLELQGELGRSLARGEQVALSRYGYWQRESDDFLHFQAIDSAGILHGLNIYRFDGGRELESLISAESARFIPEGEGGYWILQDGHDMEFLDDGMPRTESVAFDSRRWDNNLSPDLLKVLVIDPDKMAVSDLYRYASRFQRQGQDASPYYLSFWRKVLQPLTTAALVIVAVSFIFGPLREATMGSRVFTAICFGILFVVFQRLLSTVSLVYQLSPLMAVLVPILACLALGIGLLKRTV